MGDGAEQRQSMADTEAECSSLLLDTEAPIEARIRALFSLRNIPTHGSVSALAAAMNDASELLAHEAAFALGQMGRPAMAAIPDLSQALRDTSQHPIVRHEAAEALGNLGGEGEGEEADKLGEPILSTLRAYLDDSAPEVRETCQLAVHRLEAVLRGRKGSQAGDARTADGQEGSDDAEKGKSEDGARPSRFVGVDPSITLDDHVGVPTSQLRENLLDETLPLQERYGALFALRDRAAAGSCALAGVAVIEGLLRCGSALLRHEVAYVLGQLQDPASVSALSDALQDPAVHPMVRHEAAVALGSVGDASSVELLERLRSDPEPIVAESCRVALDMMGQ